MSVHNSPYLSQELKVNLFIIGPTRTGSTWLHKELSKLNRVSVSPKKETYLFLDQIDDPVAECLRTFSKNASILIDINPTYFDSDTALKIIGQHFPNSKVLVVCRGVLDLAMSIYKYRIQAGRKDGEFEDFVRSDNKSRFDYNSNLQVLFDNIKKEDIYFFSYSRFCENPYSLLAYILELVDVGDLGFDTKARSKTAVNKSGFKPRHTGIYLFMKRIGALIQPILGKRLIRKIRDKIVTNRYLSTEVKRVDPSAECIEYFSKHFYVSNDHLSNQLLGELNYGIELNSDTTSAISDSVNCS